MIKCKLLLGPSHLKALACFGQADAFGSESGTPFLENLTGVDFEKLLETQALGHLPCNFVNNVLLMGNMVIISILPLRNSLQLQLTEL